MRKLISALLVVVVLCGWSLVVPAFAAEADTYEYMPTHVDCKSDNVYPGARVTLYADYFTDGAVPTGATLKFQWYKNSVNSNEGGTKIELSEANSQGNQFIANTSQVGTIYYYVIMTYTPSGGEPVLYKSDAIAVTVEAKPGTHPLTNLLTPAEASGWMRTTTSQEVLDLCDIIAENSDGRIRMETVRQTKDGRDIPLMIIGKPAPASPADVPEDKALVFFSASVHAGEVEGKETSLIFAREAAMGLHDDFLEDIVILIMMNSNPDGNDALGKNRNNTQYTPKLVGTRTNAESGSSYYNINRDFTKLDTAEARALITVLNTWDPEVTVDLHGTNGTLQRHGLESRTNLHPDEYAPLLQYNRDEFTELAVGSQSYFLEKTGWVTAPYGDFTGGYVDGGRWVCGSQEFARFTTNYVGMRNRMVLLFEAYSHDPFTVRVDIHYYSMISFLMAIQDEKDTIKQLIADADAKSLARADGLDPEEDIVTLLTKIGQMKDANGDDVTVTVKSYVANANNSVINYVLRDDEGDRSGTVYAGLKDYQNVRYEAYGEPVTQEPLGAYYLIEQDCVEAIEVLQAHGIEMAQLAAPVTLKAGEYQWYNATVRTRSNLENHSMNQLTGTWETGAGEQVFPAGTYAISSAQILGNLAAYIIEPASPDGIVAWNLVDKQMENYDGTVRADYVSTLNSGSKIAIPIFKMSDFELLDLDPTNVRVKVWTDAHLPQPGDSFRVWSKFGLEKASNAAVLDFTFDTDKYEYKGFTPASGVQDVNTEPTDTGVKITVMIQDYNAQEFGELLLSVKDDAVLGHNEYNKVGLTIAYVVKGADGEKTTFTAEGSTLFLTGQIPDEFTLIDLSDLIDGFGTTSKDADWPQYRIYDFNNSGDIDIYDISYMAKLIP